MLVGPKGVNWKAPTKNWEESSRRATPGIDAIPSKNLKHFGVEKVDAIGLNQILVGRWLLPRDKPSGQAS